MLLSTFRAKLNPRFAPIPVVIYLSQGQEKQNIYSHASGSIRSANKCWGLKSQENTEISTIKSQVNCIVSNQVSWHFDTEHS